MIGWLVNAIILMALGAIVPGITIASFWAALGAVFLIGLVNVVVKPLFVILTLPVTVLTLGLFLLFINSIMFYFAGSVFHGFQVHGAFAAIVGSLVYSLAGSLISTRARG